MKHFLDIGIADMADIVHIVVVVHIVDVVHIGVVGHIGVGYNLDFDFVGMVIDCNCFAGIAFLFLFSINLILNLLCKFNSGFAISFKVSSII